MPMEGDLFAANVGLAHQPAKRWVAHLDMDAFFASIEKRDNPTLKTKPVLVGHLLRGRGVVASADYLARRQGVRSGMASCMARQRCPQGVFIAPRIAHYMEVSRQLAALLTRLVPCLEQSSCDEAWLELTSRVEDVRHARIWIQQIRRSIWQELGLTCSVGLAPNKALAKMASKQNKPNGVFVIEPANVLTFLDSQPLEAISGLGQMTHKKLKQLAIHTMIALREQPISFLVQHFGTCRGRFLYDRARGIDPSQVVPRQPAKSASAQHTLEQDMPINEHVLACFAQLLWRLHERVHLERLRPEKIEIYGYNNQHQWLSTSIRNINGFTTVTDIWQHLVAWLPHHWADQVVRSIIVRLPHLLYPHGQQKMWHQLSLFPNKPSCLQTMPGPVGGIADPACAQYAP